jgi:radical SAM superfamily enzyme with C-terminal helix-hairpin-helix motif
MIIELINKNFITEQKCQVQIQVHYEKGFYHFRIVKQHMILAMFQIPDPGQMDAPIPNDSMYDRISELVPHLRKVIDIFEKP